MMEEIAQDQGQTTLETAMQLSGLTGGESIFLFAAAHPDGEQLVVAASGSKQQQLEMLERIMQALALIYAEPEGARQ